MAIGTLVKRIFETSEVDARALVVSQYIQALENEDAAARVDAQRLLDWYMRKDVEILEHLKERARRTFDSTDDWQFPISNAVPRTIRRVSMSYQQPPVREYIDGKTGETIPPTDERVARLVGMYGKLNRDKKLRALDRFSTLLNTVHAEVVYRRGAIDWDIRLRPSVTVLPDPEDFLEFAQFAWQWNPVDPETLEPKFGWVYWSDESWVWISKGGVQVGMAPDGSGRNPYKDFSGQPVIPVATVRKNDDIDEYWGRLGADLVDAVEVMNVQLGNMWETMALQIHGQPIFINVDVKDGATVKLGPKHPLVAKKVMKDDVPPDIRFPKPDPDLEECRAVLDWYRGEVGLNYGLNPGADSQDQQPESGFAKFVANMELIENRDELLNTWSEVEVDLDTKSRIVWNTWSPQSARVPSPDEVALRVTFPDVPVPETPTEKETRWALKVQSGFASVVDYFMEVEGLDESAALKRARDVKKVNEQLRGSGAQPTNRLPEEDDEDEEGNAGGQGGAGE